jgi:hypothetical protein
MGASTGFPYCTTQGASRIFHCVFHFIYLGISSLSRAFTDVSVGSGIESFESESVNNFLRFLASKQDNFGG